MKQTNSRWEHFLNHFEWGDLVMFILLIILIFLILFPFWWVLRTSLTSPNAVYTNIQSLTPVDTTVLNFQRVLGMVDPRDLIEDNPNISAGVINFWIFMRNSFIV